LEAVVVISFYTAGREGCGKVVCFGKPEVMKTRLEKEKEKNFDFCKGSKKTEGPRTVRVCGDAGYRGGRPGIEMGRRGLRLSKRISKQSIQI